MESASYDSDVSGRDNGIVAGSQATYDCRTIGPIPVEISHLVDTNSGFIPVNTESGPATIFLESLGVDNATPPNHVLLIRKVSQDGNKVLIKAENCRIEGVDILMFGQVGKVSEVKLRTDGTDWFLVRSPGDPPVIRYGDLDANWSNTAPHFSTTIPNGAPIATGAAVGAIGSTAGIGGVANPVNAVTPNGTNPLNAAMSNIGSQFNAATSNVTNAFNGMAANVGGALNGAATNISNPINAATGAFANQVNAATGNVIPAATSAINNLPAALAPAAAVPAIPVA